MPSLVPHFLKHNFIKVIQSSPGLVKLLSGYVQSGKAPYKVTQYVTFRCNLKCRHCLRYDQSPAENLNPDEIMDIMVHFKKMGTVIWGFNGGEPLLYQKLGQLITCARKLRFITSINTNGSLIKDKIEEIKQIDKIYISLDGVDDEHNFIRGEGEFAKIVASIELLKRYNKRISILSLLHKKNGIDGIVSFSKEYKIPLYFLPLGEFSYSDMDGLDIIRCPSSTASKIHEKLQKYRFHGAVSNSVLGLQYLASQVGGEKNFIIPRCYAGTFWNVITPDGFLLPCIDLISQKCRFKNIRKTNFIGLKDAVSNIGDFRYCRKCRYNCYFEENLFLSGKIL